MDIEIREGSEAEREAILALYPDMFPQEELRPLVSALLDDPSRPLSLVADGGGRLVGHALFTPGQVQGCTGDVALLGPLGVASAHQRRGLGTQILRRGMALLAQRGIAQVFLLGDPAYYGRLGFQAERSVTPPCPIPEEWADAWQSHPTGDTPWTGTGRLSLPAPWMDPRLWQ